MSDNKTFKITNLGIEVLEDVKGTRGSKKQYRKLFQDLTIELHESEILVIQGASGCGKSSLLEVIAGFVNTKDANKKNDVKWHSRKWFNADKDRNIYFSGSICRGEIVLTDLDPRERELGYLTQNSKIYPHHRSPQEVLCFPYQVNPKIKKAYKSKDSYSKKAQEVFNSLNIDIKYTGSVENISGGEEQRLLLGKYILIRPKILLLDEPFSNLDYTNRIEMRDRIKMLAAEGVVKYVIMVSHDLDDCRIANKILHIQNNVCHLIEENQFETAYEVYSRLYGIWKDENDRIVKDSTISKLVHESRNAGLVEAVMHNFLTLYNISNADQDTVIRMVQEKWSSDKSLEESLKQKLTLTQNRKQHDLLDQRANKIFHQVTVHIPESDTVCDYGCGDGLVSLKLNQEKPNLKIDLYDVIDYRAEEVISNTSLLFRNLNILPQITKSYDSSLLITVLHHTSDPHAILKEVCKITTRRIVIIESVLGISSTDSGNFSEYPNQRLEYARFVDWSYNRIAHDDVPVPYNFLCVDDWKKMFQRLDGWACSIELDLGKDIDIVPEHHYLFVLTRRDH